MIRNMLLKVVLLSLLLLPFGCGEKRQASETVLRENEHEYVLTILLDMSGSFAHLMAEQGKAYEFIMEVIDRYFRDRMGTQDGLVVAQISGSDRSLLWQGTPFQLRQDFPSASAFRDFLKQRSNSAGSRVHDGITQTVEYVMSDLRIQSKTAKSAVFVLSDMLDNFPDSDASKKKTVEMLKAYGRIGGTFGLYYVDQLLVPEWRTHLRDSGIKHWRVEAEIVGRPTLPDFEQ